MEPYDSESYHNYEAQDAAGWPVAVIAVKHPVGLEIFGKAVRDAAEAAMHENTEAVNLMPINPIRALYNQSRAIPVIYAAAKIS